MELQRLRVEHIVLREITLSVSDPNAYKEFNLLNRMMLAFDDEDNDQHLEEESQRQTEARLLARGISKESAQRIAKVLSSAQPPPDKEKDPDDEEEDVPEVIVPIN